MSRISVADVTQFVESLAAPALAEDWDNVGLLLGDAEGAVQAVMTCLTLTPDVAAEAIERKAGLVVTHHPILFRSIKRLTTDTSEGRMLLELVRAGVAVYSPHTAFDNGAVGINQWLAKQLGLKNIATLRPIEGPASAAADGPSVAGSGRYGDFAEPISWTKFQKKLETKLNISQYQYVGVDHQPIQRVGIACGAAAEFLREAHLAGCQAFLTGEARFHACLEARSLGMGMILLGHYASERPALEMLANQLSNQFRPLSVWASEKESDPISWVSSDE